MQKIYINYKKHSSNFNTKQNHNIFSPYKFLGYLIQGLNKVLLLFDLTFWTTSHLHELHDCIVIFIFLFFYFLVLGGKYESILQMFVNSLFYFFMTVDHL